MVGLLNINKPSGISSRRVVDVVARLAGTRRVGHAGTLDPLASGVLVVCVGWATRLVGFVQERQKVYRATFLLGRTSATDDVTSDLVEVPNSSRPTRLQVETALRTFVGQVKQVPPQFSAVHVDGKRAHKLARRGATVNIEPRMVFVHGIDLIEYDFPNLELRIECGSGTYVRSIGRDLGSALGCGAVISALVRQSIGEFSLETALGLDELQARPLSETMLPPLAAVGHLPRRTLSPCDREELLFGRAIACLPPEAGFASAAVALVDSAGRLQALAEHDPQQQVLRPRHVFIQQPAPEIARASG